MDNPIDHLGNAIDQYPFYDLMINTEIETQQADTMKNTNVV